MIRSLQEYDLRIGFEKRERKQGEGLACLSSSFSSFWVGEVMSIVVNSGFVLLVVVLPLLLEQFFLWFSFVCFWC